jgi:hypothetical protein
VTIGRGERTSRGYLADRLSGWLHVS